jgi:uncharacterized protein
MILNLREFENFPARKLLQGDPKAVQLDFESVAGLDKIELQLNIQKSGDEYYCQGDARAHVKLTCARCLGEFDQDLENSTDFIICSSEWHQANRDILDNEDYVYFQGSDLHADLSEIVRQAIITAVSLKPLCSEECRGLCAQCGTNLNEEDCRCDKNRTDARWEGLRKLSGLT